MNDYGLFVHVVWPYVAMIFGVLLIAWPIEHVDRRSWQRWADSHIEKPLP